MPKHMSLKDMHDAKFRVKPRAYDLYRVYSPHAFVGSAGRNHKELDSIHVEKTKNGRYGVKAVLAKFYNRFPMLKLMPQTFYARLDFGTNTPTRFAHPA